MKIPDTVKVGGLVYTVSREKIVKGGESHEPYLGMTNNDMLEITVGSNYPEQQQQETMIHETLHAAFYVFNLRHHVEGDTDREEALIKDLTHALHAIVVDNPDLWGQVS